MFFATTVNSFRNESFDHNIYFERNATSPIRFPCLPTAVLSEGRNLRVGEGLQSPSGTVYATMQVTD